MHIIFDLVLLFQHFVLYRYDVLYLFCDFAMTLT